jgi:hypothetical protein
MTLAMSTVTYRDVLAADMDKVMSTDDVVATWQPHVNLLQVEVPAAAPDTEHVRLVPVLAEAARTLPL